MMGSSPSFEGEFFVELPVKKAPKHQGWSRIQLVFGGVGYPVLLGERWRERFGCEDVFFYKWGAIQNPRILKSHRVSVVSDIFYFYPLGKISNLTNIFQMGWNHQLDRVSSVCWKWGYVIVTYCPWDFSLVGVYVMHALRGKELRLGASHWGKGSASRWAHKPFINGATTPITNLVNG